MTMFGRKKKKQPDFIETVSGHSTILSINDSEAGLDFLVSFISAVRPSRSRGGPREHPPGSLHTRPPGGRDAAANLAAVTAALHQSPVLLSNLQHAILSQLV